MSHETPQKQGHDLPRPELAKDENSAKLTGAKDALKKKLLRAVMQQAMAEIGEPAAIAEKVLSAFRSDMPQVPAASDRLRELLVAEIARSALDSIADSETTAREIGQSIPVDHGSVQSVVDALAGQLGRSIEEAALNSIADSETTAREIADSISIDHVSVRTVIDALGSHLTRSIREAALASIADVSSTARSIADNISIDQDEIRSVIEALRDHLTATVREQALGTFANVEEIARGIRSSISDDDDLLAAVRSRVYEILVADSRTMSLSRLEDIKAVAAEIRDGLGEEPESVLRIASEVRRRLLDETRRRSEESLSVTDDVASEIISTIGDNPDVVSNAVEEVRSQLLDTIGSRSVEALSDSLLAANDARKRLKPNPEQVVHASEHLKDLLLREVVHNATAEFSDLEAAAREAYERVDRQSPELQRVKEELKSRILNQVLNSAIHEISSEVGTAATELGSHLVGQVTSGFESDDLDAAASDLFDDLGFDQVDPQDSESATVDAPNAEAISEQAPSPMKRNDGASTADDEDAAELESFFSSDASPSEPETNDAAEWVEDTEERDSTVDAPEDEVETAHSWRSLDAFDVEDTESAPVTIDDASGMQDVFNFSSEEASRNQNENEPLQKSEAVSDGVYYLYGIMTSAGDAFDGPLPLGIQAGRVETVDFDGLSAVVSVVPMNIFYGDALRANLGNAAWLQENVRKHASIIEQLRSRQTLLPMPFCTILPNRDKVVRMLEASYGQYFDSLDRVNGKQEWGLRIYRNRDLLDSRVSESDRRVEGALGAISRGVSGYLRDEMNRMENESRHDPVELVTEHCTQRSHEALLAKSAEGRQNPDHAGQERAGEDVVLNTAYLVDGDSDSEMRAEVERLKAEYAELGFRFELTGPWPPYHFVGADGSRTTVREAR